MSLLPDISTSSSTSSAGAAASPGWLSGGNSSQREGDDTGGFQAWFDAAKLAVRKPAASKPSRPAQTQSAAGDAETSCTKQNDTSNAADEPAQDGPTAAKTETDSGADDTPATGGHNPKQAKDPAKNGAGQADGSTATAIVSAAPSSPPPAPPVSVPPAAVAAQFPVAPPSQLSLVNSAGDGNSPANTGAPADGAVAGANSGGKGEKGKGIQTAQAAAAQHTGGAETKTPVANPDAEIVAAQAAAQGTAKVTQAKTPAAQPSAAKAGTAVKNLPAATKSEAAKPDASAAEQETDDVADSSNAGSTTGTPSKSDGAKGRESKIQDARASLVGGADDATDDATAGNSEPPVADAALATELVDATITAARAHDTAGGSTPAATGDGHAAVSAESGQNITATESSPVKTTTVVGGAESAASAQESQGGRTDATLDQIVIGLRTKLDARNGTAEIRLDPPNLGSLKVSVQLDNGTLTAQFESQNPAVRDLLSSHMDKLKSVLEGQGIPVDKLAVRGEASAPSAAPPSTASTGDSANRDGRSAGNYGYSGRQQQGNGSGSQGGKSFADMWQDRQRMDLVA